MKSKKNQNEDHQGHIKLLMYAGTVFLLVLSILAITLTGFVVKGNKNYDGDTISVTGTAEVNATPDVATFSFTVRETSKTTDEAQSVISEKLATILDGLDRIGVDKKDIKTESYTMYPRYEWVRVDQTTQKVGVDGTVYFPGENQKQVQVGFDVSQNVSVKLRDFDKVPEVLTLFGEIGVENLYGPNFHIDEPDDLQDEARKMAIAEAKEKAKQLAKDLGVRLGKVVSFNEGGNGYYPEPYYAKTLSAVAYEEDARSVAPDLPTGENTITSTVNIIYRIK
ncbi:SIMPL domain-containing protein [Patescibacteria group bacterium]|nr:SIMPL domain-containing protein [Patescibacteria group bacterium]